MPVAWFDRDANGDPDLSSVIPAGKKAIFKVLSTQPGAGTQTQVDYTLIDLVDGDLDLLREQVKGSALFDDAAWAALDAAGKAAFIRVALQKLVKFVFKGEP